MNVFAGSAQAPPLDLASASFFAGFGLLALWLSGTRPAAAIVLLLLAVPFNFARAVGPTTVDLSKVILLAAAAAIAGQGRAADFVPRGGLPRALAVAGLACAVLDAFGALHADDRGACYREAFKALEYAGFFVVAIALSRAAVPNATVLVRGVAGIAVTVTLCATLDEVAGHRSVFLLGTTVVTRIAGPLEGPNQLSGYLQLFLPILLAAALARLAPVDRLTALAAAAVTALGLALTFSRAGIVSAAVACGVVIATGLSRRSVRSRALGAASLLAAGASVVAFVRAMRSDANADDTEVLTGLATRHELWHAAIVLWQRNPLFGIGAGNYELELPSTGLLGVRTHANNYYLQTLAEGGIVSLLAALAVAALSLVALARRAPSSWVAAGTFAATIGLFAHQCFDDLFFFPKVGATWWILLAVALSAGDHGTAEMARISAERDRRALLET